MPVLVTRVTDAGRFHLQGCLHPSAKHHVDPPAEDSLQYSDDEERDVTSIVPETSPQQHGYDSAYEGKHNKADDMMAIMDRMTTLDIRGREVARQPERQEEQTKACKRSIHSAGPGADIREPVQALHERSGLEGVLDTVATTHFFPFREVHTFDQQPSGEDDGGKECRREQEVRRIRWSENEREALDDKCEACECQQTSDNPGKVG